VDTLCLSKISQINERTLNAYLDIRLQQGVKKARIVNRKRVIEITPLGVDAIRHIITYINGFLNFAVRNNYIMANPLKDIKRPKLPQRHPRFLDHAEIKAVIRSAQDEPIYPAIITAIYAGLRKGELQRLRWEDVHFDRNEIIILEAKSKKFRVVPLHPDLKKALKPLRKKKGECFDMANQRRILDRVFRKARIRDLDKKWHIFRHTFASHCVMSGVDLTTVKEYLGHANIETTMKYAHLLPTHKQEAIKKVKF
jgi:integrase